MAYFDTEVNGKNPKECIDGSNALIKELMGAIMDADKIGILTKVELKLTFKEYTDEILDLHAEEIDGRDIIIDKSSLETLKRFINSSNKPNENLNRMWNLLKDYAEGEKHGWVSVEEFAPFMKEFTELYHKEFDPNYNRHPIYEDDEFPYHDEYEINMILNELKLPFKIRRVNKKYIVDTTILLK